MAHNGLTSSSAFPRFPFCRVNDRNQTHSLLYKSMFMQKQLHQIKHSRHTQTHTHTIQRQVPVDQKRPNVIRKFNGDPSTVLPEKPPSLDAPLSIHLVFVIRIQPTASFRAISNSLLPTALSPMFVVCLLVFFLLLLLVFGGWFSARRALVKS